MDLKGTGRVKSLRELRGIPIPRNPVNKEQEEGRGDYTPPPANLVRNPGGCDPYEEGDAVIVVVLHRVSSNIRAEYELCCIRRYTASSLRIPEQLIVGTSENSVNAKFAEFLFHALE